MIEGFRWQPGPASEWEFCKLLIGLNTAVVGALLYGQEHILKTRYSLIFLLLSLAFHIYSLVASLNGARAVTNIDVMMYNAERLKDANLMVPIDISEQYSAVSKVYVTTISYATRSFKYGILSGVIFFLWNMFVRRAAS